jgi:putative PIN family toxin of toxin-antitoxin system
LIFGGKPLRLLEMALAGELSLAVSEAIVEETIGVLRDKFGKAPDQLIEAETYIGRCADRVVPTITLDAVPDDPDDNRVLECAVAAGAALIVSGDGDLLRLGNFEGIQIVKLAELLEVLEGAGR